jgi:GDSL-like Lipase/Acylhydrolase family
MKKPKRKRYLRRVLFSFIILVVCIELSLQAAHYMNSSFNSDSSLKHPGAPVILCVGDSHTYGTKMDEGADYPAQLQKRFERNSFPVNVINQGVPGTNTSELRRKLPGLMKKYNPDLVIVLVCVNNDWNRKDTTWSDIQDKIFPQGIVHIPKRLWYSFGDSLRTARLVSYTWKVYNPGTLSNEIEKDRDGNVYVHDWGGKGNWDGPYLNILKRTKRDLDAIVQTIRSAESEPVFLTYAGQPFSPMSGANATLKGSALQNAVLFIDNDKVIRSLYVAKDGRLDLEKHAELFLTDPGETHLDAAGYEVVADNIYRVIKRQNLLKKTGSP